MAGGKATYCGLITKARAMQGKLLPVGFYEEILELSNTREIVEHIAEQTDYKSVLKNKDGILHRQQVETVLRESIYRDYERLYHFSDSSQQKAMQILYLQYQAEAIKRCLLYLGRQRKIFTPYEREFLGSRGSFRAEDLENALRAEEFVEALKQTCYYNRLKVLLDQQKFYYHNAATIIDITMYETCNKRIQKLDSRNQKPLQKLYGTECDWMNIQWIGRMIRFYRMRPAEIFAATIPVYYQLKREEVLRMVEAVSPQEFNAIVQKTYYGKAIRGEPAKEGAMQIAWQDELYENVAVKSPFSIAPVYRYLHQKEKEITRLTTAIEGIHYQMEPLKLRDLVLKEDGGNYSG